MWPRCRTDDAMIAIQQMILMVQSDAPKCNLDVVKSKAQMSWWAWLSWRRLKVQLMVTEMLLQVQLGRCQEQDSDAAVSMIISVAQSTAEDETWMRPHVQLGRYQEPEAVLWAWLWGCSLCIWKHGSNSAPDAFWMLLTAQVMLRILIDCNWGCDSGGAWNGLWFSRKQQFLIGCW